MTPDPTAPQGHDVPAKVEPPKLDLEALANWAAKATPVPWAVVEDPIHSGLRIVCQSTEFPVKTRGNWIATLDAIGRGEQRERRFADASLMAAAPAMLDEVTRQRGVIQRLLDQNGEMAVMWKKRLDERDEARKWARSAMTVLLEQESCGDPEEDEEAREVLARWDAETAATKEPS